MLILDEPTNDLDIITLNVLEDFLMDYPGVVVLASHDRYMLDKMADHLFVFEGGGVIKDFPGGYSAYVAWKAEQDSAGSEQPAAAESPKRTISAAEREEVRKALRRVEKTLAQLEASRSRLESNFLLENPALDDLQRWDQELRAVRAQLEEAEVSWLELSEQLDQMTT